MLIMVDGMDGSGKSTIVEAWKNHLTTDANAIFDLRLRGKETGDYPTLDELRSYDIIFSGEPTYAGIGKVIREELIKNGTDYPPKAIAEAYSLDRLILYKKIIIPLIKDNKLIIQDRGVSTSLCYQPLSGEMDLDFVAKLPGNELALNNRPDHLVIVHVSPEEAMRRLAKRADKQDDVIFEKLDFQKKVSEIFLSEEYRMIFESYGTEVHYLSGDEKIDIMKQKAVDLFKQIVY